MKRQNRGWSGMHAEILDPKNQRVSRLDRRSTSTQLIFQQLGDFKEWVDCLLTPAIR
jgi:hypothetical protein